MRRTSWLRIALVANAAVVAVGLAINMAHTINHPGPEIPTLLDQIVDEFSYFTIDTNYVCLAVCIAYALRPRTSNVILRHLRFIGLINIAVTGICYYLLVASELNYVGVYKVGDVLVHVVSPVLYIGTWLILGPRGQTRWWNLASVFAFTTLWVVLTSIRGAASGIYPYGFLDVSDVGYSEAGLYVLAITAAAMVLGIGAIVLDGFLSRRDARVLEVSGVRS